jgi:hypothetical protein
MTTKRITKSEARRLAILAEAERLPGGEADQHCLSLSI